MITSAVPDDSLNVNVANNILIKEDDSRNAEEISLPPDELIEANLNDTDVTLGLEVTKFELQEERVADIYATFKIIANVTKVYKGEYRKGEEIEFFKTIEYQGDVNEAKPYQNKNIIVSFIIGDNDNLQIPDVGYEFYYSKELDVKFESVDITSN